MASAQADAGALSRVASPRIRWRDAPAHVVMVAVMAGTMAVEHSVPGDLAGILVLVVTSLAYAPGARRDATFREHLVDLWAMALTLFACLPSHGAAGIAGSGAGGSDQHSGSPGGPLLVGAILAAWLVTRVAFARGAVRVRGGVQERGGDPARGGPRARGGVQDRAEVRGPGAIGAPSGGTGVRVVTGSVVTLVVVGAGLAAMVAVCALT